MGRRDTAGGMRYNGQLCWLVVGRLPSQSRKCTKVYKEQCGKVYQGVAHHTCQSVPSQMPRCTEKHEKLTIDQVVNKLDKASTFWMH